VHRIAVANNLSSTNRRGAKASSVNIHSQIYTLSNMDLAYASKLSSHAETDLMFKSLLSELKQRLRQTGEFVPRINTFVVGLLCACGKTSLAVDHIR
jgi:hypothetical protein